MHFVSPPRNPSPTEILYRKASSHHEALDYGEALMIYDQILKIEPDNINALYRKAIILSATNKQKEAEQILKQAIGIEICQLKGGMSYDCNDAESMKKAMELYDRDLRAHEPAYNEKWYYKGRALALQGEYKRAIECMDNILCFEPKTKYEYRPVLLRAWRLKGSCLYLLQRFTDAEQYFHTFISKENIAMHFEMTYYLAATGEYEKALEIVDKILRLEPENTRALANKVTCLSMLGRDDEAKEWSDRYEEFESSNWEFWYNKGHSLAVDGLNEKAISLLDKAIKLDPNKAEPRIRKGICLYKLGRYMEAIQCYDEALRIAPDSYTIWFEKGLSHLELGERELATLCIDKVLALGNSLFAVGRYYSALEAYSKLIEIRPFDAWLSKGLTLSKLGRYQEAIACFDEALQIKPYDPRTLEEKETARKKLALG